MAQSPFEIPAELRDMAQKSVEQARVAVGQFMEAAQKAMNSAGGTAFPVPPALTEMGAKAVAFAQTNAKATFDHAQKLVLAKDMQEVLTLQSEFLKSQIATLQAQAKEVGAALQQAMAPKA